MSLNRAVRVFLFLLMGMAAVVAQAQQEGAEARALLAEAVDYYKENGDQALAVFSRQGPFVRGDLYVFALNTNGIMLASGGPSIMLLGRDLFNTIGEEHRLQFQQALSSSQEGQVHEADYSWGNWNTAGRVLTKHVYYQRVGDTVLVVGYYNPRASSEQALELLDTASDAISKSPRETFTAINSLDQRYYKDDLYVVVVELDSKRFVAHGSNLRMIGRSFATQSDSTGKPFGREVLEQLGGSDVVEFDYQWEHPISGEMEQKHGFARQVGDYLVIVGHYEPHNGNGAD